MMGTLPAYGPGLYLLDDHNILWPKKYWGTVAILHIVIVAKINIKLKP